MTQCSQILSVLNRNVKGNKVTSWLIFSHEVLVIIFLVQLLCVAEIWGFVLDLVGFFLKTIIRKKSILYNITQYKYHKTDLLCFEVSPAWLRCLTTHITARGRKAVWTRGPATCEGHDLILHTEQTPWLNRHHDLAKNPSSQPSVTTIMSLQVRQDNRRKTNVDLVGFFWGSGILHTALSLPLTTNHYHGEEAARSIPCVGCRALQLHRRSTRINNGFILSAENLLQANGAQGQRWCPLPMYPCPNTTTTAEPITESPNLPNWDETKILSL